jgi:hypothetical protein
MREIGRGDVGSPRGYHLTSSAKGRPQLTFFDSRGR